MASTHPIFQTGIENMLNAREFWCITRSWSREDYRELYNPLKVYIQLKERTVSLPYSFDATAQYARPLSDPRWSKNNPALAGSKITAEELDIPATVSFSVITFSLCQNVSANTRLAQAEVSGDDSRIDSHDMGLGLFEAGAEPLGFSSKIFGHSMGWAKELKDGRARSEGWGKRGKDLQHTL
ncbi:hypothetical protein DFH09DRAFT_1106970 [Mycena vulgaris]|nr:hypothetical protein DFH09DRAFT_1106970 [Mycena vulgaris]